MHKQSTLSQVAVSENEPIQPYPGLTKVNKNPPHPTHCQQIPTKASRVTPPTPSRSNSSIIALSSSSSSPVSPNSLATRLKSSRSINPLAPSSNSSNARRISSRGSRSRIFSAVTAWNDESGMSRLDGCWGFDTGPLFDSACAWPCWLPAAACCCWTCGRGTP
jgi:hypothetical protein